MTIEAEIFGSTVSEWNASYQASLFSCQECNVYVVKMCTWQAISSWFGKYKWRVNVYWGRQVKSEP